MSRGLAFTAAVAVALSLGFRAVGSPAKDSAVVIHGPETPAREILAADRAFSDRSAAVGTAKAFREFMDEKDGLEFAGGEPKRGAAEIYAAHGGDSRTQAVLTWKPAEVFVSAGGDLGATWGHWLLKPNDPGKKDQTGRYVTVWRKDASGGWKGVIDIGDGD